MSWLFGSRRRVTWLAVAAGCALILPSVASLFGINKTEEPEFSFSVPGYTSAVDAVDYGKRMDILCALDSAGWLVEDSHGTWEATKFQEDCNFRGEAHLFLGDEPRGLTLEQVLSAQDWYLDFLLSEFFDGRLLDASEKTTEFATSGQLSFVHPDTLSKLLGSSADDFESDGYTVNPGGLLLSDTSESVLNAVPHDGRPRLLGLQLQTGSLSVDFFGLEQDQVKFSGNLAAFYRLDKARLVEFVLRTEPEWTRGSLAEVHPEYFDDSKLALRYDVSLSHTLEKSGSLWLVTSWDSSGTSYDF